MIGKTIIRNVFWGIIPVVSMLSSAACVRPLMLADASKAVDIATDASGVIEMPPAYVESSYPQKIAGAAAEVRELASRSLNCPAVRVLRADAYERADGTSWTVVRLNACGEQRVYEAANGGWREATARLR